MRHRWRRHLAAALGAAAVFVVAAVGIGLLFLPRIVEWGVAGELAKRGIAPVHLRVRTLGLHGLEIVEVRLGRDDALRIARLSARYRPDGILAGRMDALTVEGLRLAATIDATGVHAGGLIAALGGAGGGGGAWPVAEITLTDARARLATPLGPLTVTAKGRARAGGGGIEAKLDVALGGEAGRAHGRLVVTRAADGGFRARFAIEGGRVALPRAVATGLGGSLRASGAPLRLDADLAIESLTTPALTLAGLGVVASVADGRLTVHANARDAAGKASAEAKLALALAGEPRLSLSARASSGDLAATFPKLAGLSGGAATVALDLAGRRPDTVPADAADAGWLLAQHLSGSLEIGAFAVAAPAIGRGIDADARLAVEVADGVLAVTADGPVSLAAEHLAPGPLAAALGAGPVSLAIGGDDHTGLTVEARRKGGDLALLAAAGGEAQTERGRVAVETVIEARLGKDGLARLALPALDLTVRDATLGGVRGLGGHLSASFAGTPAAMRGSFEADLTAEEAAVGTARAAELTVATAGDAAFDGRRLTVTLGDGRVRAEGLAVPGVMRTTAPLTATLTPGEAAVVRSTAAGGLAADLALGFRDIETAGTVHAGDADTRFTIGLASATARARLRGGAVAPGATVALAGGTVALPDHDLRLAELAGSLTVAKGGRLIAEITRGRADLGKRGIAPITVAATVRSEGRRLVIDGQASAAGEAVRLSVRAEHDRDSGEGRARLDLAPIHFAPGRLTPGDLAPLLAKTITALSGTLAARGTVSWHPGGQVADITVALSDLGGRVGPVRFAAVNGVIRFDSLWPPATPAGQEIAIGVLDAGVPLTDGLVRFRLAPEGTVDLARAVWHWGGGEISLGPVTLAPGRRDYDVMLRVSGPSSAGSRRSPGSRASRPRAG